MVLASLVATAALLAGSGPAATASAHSASSDLATIHVMLDMRLGDFVTLATSGWHDGWFDWSTDFCSAPLVGNTGRSFNFTQTCRRHDYGYRNLIRAERRYGVDVWNHAERLRVDRRFLADMLAHCAGRSVFLRPTCRAWAYTYYAAVRAFGGP